MMFDAWNLLTILAAVAASLPLASWAIGQLLPDLTEKTVTWISSLLTGSAFLVSVFLAIEVLQEGAVFTGGTWIDVGTEASGLALSWGILLDELSVLMLAMITGIATLVHVFSSEYLHGDKAYSRYFAHLGFFCSAMMWLVLADNLMMIFFCWELVGLASWLLIGFWREKPEAASAAQKAFIVNRVGDVGFMIGIMILIGQTGTLSLTELPTAVSVMEPGWLTAASLCLFLGAAGKSAQFPLQAWLPDAMEGPTPVSSLIHAATMVAAGVYLLGRIAVFIPPEAGSVMAFIGALTALMAALSALTQWDIKRVLAYSTISQLGYMVMGIGVGARDMALLHLFTHAFFKCALFLSAGAVIHAVHSQSMKDMGGLKDSLPKVFYSYLPPMLALAGLPLFSGFLSKDGILLGATDWAATNGGVSWLVPCMGFLAAGLTALYMGRHAWLIFFGESRTSMKIHQPGVRMVVPLIVLAGMSFWLPFALSPFNGEGSWYLEAFGTGFETDISHGLVAGISVVLALAGLGIAWWKRTDWLDISWSSQAGKTLSGHFRMDDLYEKRVAWLAFRTASISNWIDTWIIDGGINAFAWLNVHKGPSPSLSSLASNIDDTLIDGFVNGVARGVIRLGRRIRRMNSGGVQQTLGLGMLILIVIIALIWWW